MLILRSMPLVFCKEVKSLVAQNGDVTIFTITSILSNSRECRLIDQRSPHWSLVQDLTQIQQQWQHGTAYCYHTTQLTKPVNQKLIMKNSGVTHQMNPINGWSKQHLSIIHNPLLLTYGWNFSYENSPQRIRHTVINATYKTLLDIWHTAGRFGGRKATLFQHLANE